MSRDIQIKISKVPGANLQPQFIFISKDDMKTEQDRWYTWMIIRKAIERALEENNDEKLETK